MDKIVIIGAGGHARVILEILELQYPTASIVFLDDYSTDNSILGYPLSGSTEKLRETIIESCKDVGIVIAIGDNKVRKKIIMKVEKIIQGLNAIFITAIHSSAVISKRATIMPGTVIMPNVTVNTNAFVGKHVILNNNCSVDHDCKIGDFSHIDRGVHLGGNVMVGEGTHIALSSCAVSGSKIGDWLRIEPGTKIIHDI